MYPAALLPVQAAATGAASAAAAPAASMLGPIGLAIGAAGLLTNLFGQQKARKEAQEAQRKQQQAEAFNNLVRVVGGGLPGATTPVQPAPQVDYGGALGGLGNMVAGLGASRDAAAHQTWERGLKEREFKLDEAYKMGKINKEEAMNPLDVIKTLVLFEKANQPDKFSSILEMMARRDGAKIPAGQPQKINLPPEVRDILYNALGIKRAPGEGAPQIPADLGGVKVNWLN
jgi:hypothetical protein